MTAELSAALAGVGVAIAIALVSTFARAVKRWWRVRGARKELVSRREQRGSVLGNNNAWRN